jgi:hypothetical protein
MPETELVEMEGKKSMRSLRVLVVAALFLLTAAFAWSQTEPRDDSKPQEDHPEAKAPEGRPQEQVKPPKDEKQEEKARAEESKAAHDEHAQPAGKSARIPEEKFKANFGRQHTFTVTRVIQTTTIVPNQTRFVYGGYNFVILQAWPTGWVMTDQCYIDYINGEYFLIDLVHPELQVSLSVVL